MNPKRAIEVLEEYIGRSDLDRNYDKEVLTAFDQAFDALEKDVPHKPEKRKGCWICPFCWAGLTYQIHCPSCGQAIDWKEDNDDRD